MQAESKLAVKKMTLRGFTRLSTFTVWCWSLIGIYFACAALSSLSAMQDEKTPTGPLEIAFLNFTWILFEVNGGIRVSGRALSDFALTNLYVARFRLAARSW